MDETVYVLAYVKLITKINHFCLFIFIFINYRVIILKTIKEKLKKYLQNTLNPIQRTFVLSE